MQLDLKPKVKKPRQQGITPDDRSGPSYKWVYKEMQRRGTKYLNRYKGPQVKVI